MSVYSVSGNVTYVGGANSFDILNVTAGYVLTDGGPGAPASFQPAASAPSAIQSSASRSLNSVFQVSSTRNSTVNYSVDISCTSTLLGGQTGTVFLEICATSGFSSGVQELCRFVNGNVVSLAIAITVTQVNTARLSGYVPVGYYVRIRTANTTGTPTFTYDSGQEVLL